MDKKEIPNFMKSKNTKKLVNDQSETSHGLGERSNTTIKNPEKDRPIFREVKSVSEHPEHAPCKDKVITLRLNLYQVETYEIAAKKAGVTLSQYIRQAMAEKCRKDGVF